MGAWRKGTWKTGAWKGTAWADAEITGVGDYAVQLLAGMQGMGSVTAPGEILGSASFVVTFNIAQDGSGFVGQPQHVDGNGIFQAASLHVSMQGSGLSFLPAPGQGTGSLLLNLQVAMSNGNCTSILIKGYLTTDAIQFGPSFTVTGPAKHSVIYPNTASALNVKGLKNHNGVYQNDAQVTLENLYDKRTGEQVTGLTYPAALQYVAFSDGDYNLAIPATIEVVKGRAYTATIKAISSKGVIAVWDELIRVRVYRA